jgi:hypothetical protein
VERKREETMIAPGKAGKVLEDLRVNVKIRLAALWLVLMLIYIYVDIFSFYRPGAIQEILAGKVWEFEISQAWALGALVLMMIPSLMAVVSLIVKAAVSRWANIIVGIVYVAVGIGSSIGEIWAFFILGHAVGVVLLICIIWTAARWPREET